MRASVPDVPWTGGCREKHGLGGPEILTPVLRYRTDAADGLIVMRVARRLERMLAGPEAVNAGADVVAQGGGLDRQTQWRRGKGCRRRDLDWLGGRLFRRSGRLLLRHLSDESQRVGQQPVALEFPVGVGSHGAPFSPKTGRVAGKAT